MDIYPATACLKRHVSLYCDVVSGEVTLHRNISKFRSPQHHFETFTSTKKFHKLFAGLQAKHWTKTTCHPSTTMTPWTPQVPHQSSTETFAGRFPPGWTQSLRVQLESTPKIASEGCEGLGNWHPVILTSQVGWGPKPYLPFTYFQLFQLPSPPSLTGIPIWPLHSTILVQGHVKALCETICFSQRLRKSQIQINMWPKIDVN